MCPLSLILWVMSEALDWIYLVLNSICKRHYQLILHISESYTAVQFSSVARSYATLCDPMNCSTPGLLLHHQLPEFMQINVHSFGDAIQRSHPLSSSSPPAPKSLPASESFPMSQLFAWGGQSIGVSALASFLPKKSQGWSPLEWIGWIGLV